MKLAQHKSVLVFAIIATLLVGCQTPAHTVYNSGTVLHLANRAMITAFKTKKIDRDQFEAYAIASRAAFAAVTALEDARLSGDTAKIEDLTRVAAAEVAKAMLIKLNSLGEEK